MSTATAEATVRLDRRSWVPLFDEACDEIRRSGASRADAEKALNALALRAESLALAMDDVRQFLAAEFPTPPPPEIHDTDKGNGARFANQHRGLVLYSQARRQFFVFGGRRFVVEATCEAHALAKKTIESLWDEAKAEPDHQRQQALRKHALRSESARALGAMLECARSEPGIAIDESDFDRDPMLLNVLNGTIDLRDGTLRPHNPEDRISKLVPVEYQPDATCPVFDACLRRFMQDDEPLIAFLWQLMGYFLTGSVQERNLFLGMGPTRTFKSTFVHVMDGILGDYAMTAQPELLLASRWGASSNGPSEDLARLRGARFVSCIESDADRDLSIARVKMLTGTDRITARFLHQNSITFDPTFKVLLATNEPPDVKDPADATWSRLVRIPFDVQVPEDEVDPHFFETKLAPELPGILASAVAACIRWQVAGRLVLPEKVRAAVKEYRTEQDVLGQFIASSCVPEGLGNHADLYRAFVQFFEEAFGKDDTPPTSNSFSRQLTARGYKHHRSAIARRWVGLSLRVNRDA